MVSNQWAEIRHENFVINFFLKWISYVENKNKNSWSRVNC